MKSPVLSFSLYILTAAISLFVFLFPLFSPLLLHGKKGESTFPGEMALTLTLLLALSLLVVLYEVQSHSINTKLIALLGVLVAINAALRFIEVAIPGPGGFSPIFLLIILTGYVFGARFGFLMGTMTILVSALVTGGVGPWLPNQMFIAGWVGMTAPVCLWFVRRLQGEERRREVIALSLFGALWGILFGVLMSLWGWTFIAGAGIDSLSSESSLTSVLGRYGSYYLVTSLVWDVIRALGNFILILVFGAAVLRSLRRFKERFFFNYTPLTHHEVEDLLPKQDQLGCPPAVGD
jgi:energy-coupling factor transport system substrate-specific component